MATYPIAGGTGNPRNSNDPRVDEMMEDMPNREVFVKDADGHMMGTGMILLEDNSLLAPEGFSTESGSINFGDLVTLSEASGFLAIQNNINGQRYRLIDHWVPKNAPSSKPRYVHMFEAENEFIAQPNSSTVLNANPLVFSYTTQLTSRVNGITFKASSLMSNVRVKITDVGSGTVVKYLPTKASWSQNKDGLHFDAGDNFIDFKDTPLLFTPNTELRYEIKADSVALLGSVQGQPFMSAMIQRGEFKYLADEDEVPTHTSHLINDSGFLTPDSINIPEKISDLQNDTAFITSEQAPVQSINGQQGNVTIVIPEPTPSDWETINNRPVFADVAFTGEYQSLSGKPAVITNLSQLSNDSGYVTASQASTVSPVQSVNGQTGNVSISIPAVPTNVSSLTNDAGYLTSINSSLISTALGFTPYNGTTNPNNYVTSTALTTTLGGYTTTSQLNLGLSAKFNTPAGTASQYVRGDGSIATFPAIPTVNYPVSSVNSKTGAVVLSTTDVSEGTNQYFTNARVQAYLAAQGYRRVETFTGTTNASGDYIITFANTYSVIPDVQAQLFPSTTANQIVRIISISTTGCTVRVEQRNPVTVLGLEVLLAGVAVTSGATVSVQVTPRS